MANSKAAIAALGVLTVMAAVFLLLRSLQSNYVMIRAYTDDAGGLDEGTAVRLNGITIGDLDKLNLTKSHDPKRKIEFVMKVKRRYLPEIPDDSVVGVASTNLLGNYFIDIMQGRSPRTVQPWGELATTAAVDPNKLMGQMGSEFQQIQAIFDRVDKLLQDVDSGQGNIGMWQKEGGRKMKGINRELDRLTASIRNSHGNLSKFKDLSSQMDSTEARLHELTAGFQAEQGPAGKLKAISDEASQMSAEMNHLTADLKSPQGPQARFTGIQQRAAGLTDRMQSTIDHINAGQGTLGQLTINPQLSIAIEKAEADFQSVAKGLQANPRKFLSFQVKLF